MMLFWIIATVIVSFVTISITMPVLRRKDDRIVTGARASYALLKAQREELTGKDDPEAGALMQELDRRLLILARTQSGMSSTAKSKATGTRTAIILVGLMITATVGAYLWLEPPLLPDQPYAARLADLAQKRTATTTAPDLVPGWVALAEAEARLGHHAESAEAFRQAAIRWTPPETVPNDLLESYGEQLVLASPGQVPAPAEAVFKLVYENWRQMGTARCPWRAGYYHGWALAKQGQRAAAHQVWSDILSCGSPADPWYVSVQQAIEQTPEP